jgi:heme exporter protein CcmD
MSAFLSQGGYGFYVWTSYGISAAAIALLAVWVIAGYHQAKTRLEALSDDERKTP